MDKKWNGADRLRAAVEMAGGATRVSTEHGVSLSTLNKWMAGTAPRADALAALCAAIGADLNWLSYGSGKPEQLPPPPPPGADFPSVPRYNVALSAGHGSFIERAEQLDSIPFTADFFTRRLGRGPKGLAIVDARGDSMEPTISDRDLVLIDTTDTQLTPAIWAFTLGDAVLVKRLQPTQAGIVQVASDNPAYAPFVIDRANADGFHLIGRVVWVGRVV